MDILLEWNFIGRAGGKPKAQHLKAHWVSSGPKGEKAITTCRCALGWPCAWQMCFGSKSINRLDSATFSPMWHCLENLRVCTTFGQLANVYVRRNMSFSKRAPVRLAQWLLDHQKLRWRMNFN